MKYASIGAGIEAASVAWIKIGFTPVWFSEIDAFPCKVLQYHYPDVPNIGDITKRHENEIFKQTTFNLLVGGTPCQSFSLAGLREGLHSKNGNLTMHFAGVLSEKRPSWFLWENVPGVFSSYSDETEDTQREERSREVWQTSDFASILEAFRQCGYSLAWRVLDSQHFGVPQRRRRVFVVGHLGKNWGTSFAVLFERESMFRDFTKSRKKRQKTTSNPSGCAEPNDSLQNSNRQADQVIVLKAANTSSAGKGYNENGLAYTLDTGGPCRILAFGDYNTTGPLKIDTTCLTSAIGTDTNSDNIFLPQPILYSIMPQNNGKDYNAKLSTVTQPLMTGYSIKGNQGGDIILHAFVFTPKKVDLPPCYSCSQGDKINTTQDAATPINLMLITGRPSDEGKMGTGIGKPGQPGNTITKAHSHGVFYQNIIRRLTPLECERLQAFPDGYTNIPGATDYARYKALGNSMTTHVIRWIGNRIKLVESVLVGPYKPL